MRKEMNMKNRLLASILIIGICAAGFPVSAGAEEVPEGNGVIRPVGIQEIELELDPDVKVVPGDVLMLETEIIKRKGPIGVGSAKATVNGKLVAKATMAYFSLHKEI